MAIVKRSISITEQQNQWVKSRLESGDFGNESEVYRDLIRRAQEYEQKLAFVRGAVTEGERDIAEGRSTKISSREELKEFFEDIKQTALKKL